MTGVRKVMQEDEECVYIISVNAATVFSIARHCFQDANRSTNRFVLFDQQFLKFHRRLLKRVAANCISN